MVDTLSSLYVDKVTTTTTAFIELTVCRDNSVVDQPTFGTPSSFLVGRRGVIPKQTGASLAKLKV